MATADVVQSHQPSGTAFGPLDETELEIPPFDPAIHLNFQPPAARHSFTELGLEPPRNAPNVCYTEPFQLFSEEGVRMIRRELFRKKFLDRFLRSWHRAPCYISGHMKEENQATFIKQAWAHPTTQSYINAAFGYALQPLKKEADVGYVNVQLGADGVAGVYKLTETPSTPLPASQNPISEYDCVPIDAWHKDMNPVVCVVMLSDTSTMEGGETAIRTGDGSIIKARGGRMGAAVLMQGGHTEHAALRATNCPERVSMVTSYCFADPDADDSRTSLKSVDPVHDDMSGVLNAFLGHKLERLKDRVDVALGRLKESEEKGEFLGREEVEGWVKEQISFLKLSAWEMFERIPDYLGKEIPEGVLENYLSDV